MKKFILLFCLIGLVGCTQIDPTYQTEPEPIKSPNFTVESSIVQKETDSKINTRGSTPNRVIDIITIKGKTFIAVTSYKSDCVSVALQQIPE